MNDLQGINIYDILKYIPHRYPFLLVDRVRECELGKHIVAIKNVSINEPYFMGHFPQRPVMPGVLIIEALAQATAVLAFRSDGLPPENVLYYLAGIDKVRFRHPVEPGDQLILKADLRRTIRGVGIFDTRAEVDGRVVASAELRCAPRKFADD